MAVFGKLRNPLNLDQRIIRLADEAFDVQSVLNRGDFVRIGNEIVKVTGTNLRTGAGRTINAFMVDRGQEGTGRASHLAGVDIDKLERVNGKLVSQVVVQK